MLENKDMKVVILCGGPGTRLKEETEFKPKPLVTIGKMPILWHIMKIYSHYGFRDFVLCLGYKGALIKEYFLNYRWMGHDFTLNVKNNARKIEDFAAEKIEDWTITFADTGLDTNTGGRIKRIERYIKTDDFFATYGDGLANMNIQDLLIHHKNSGKIATMTALHPLSKYGILEIEKGTVTYFKEKPRMKEWVSGGFFVFKSDIFDYLDDNSVLERQPFERLAKEREVTIFSHTGYWGCMDTFKDAMKLNELWNSGERPWKVWK